MVEMEIKPYIASAHPWREGDENKPKSTGICYGFSFH
jgi:hypothetical protein